jgi:hypothetical protein
VDELDDDLLGENGKNNPAMMTQVSPRNHTQHDETNLTRESTSTVDDDDAGDDRDGGEEESLDRKEKKKKQRKDKRQRRI